MHYLVASMQAGAFGIPEPFGSARQICYVILEGRLYYKSLKNQHPDHTILFPSDNNVIICFIISVSHVALIRKVKPYLDFGFSEIAISLGLLDWYRHGTSIEVPNMINPSFFAFIKLTFLLPFSTMPF